MMKKQITSTFRILGGLCLELPQNPHCREQAIGKKLHNIVTMKVMWSDVSGCFRMFTESSQIHTLQTTN